MFVSRGSFKFFLSAVILIALSPKTLSAVPNCVSSSITIPVNSTFFQVTFNFVCTGDQYTDANPVFPQSLITIPGQFNLIDLSPNLYTAVPIAQLCPFKYVYKLDLSRNKVTSIRGIFSQLSCMTSLTHIDLSNNAISTAIVATDFDDVLSSRLVSLNLTNNQIVSIASGVFLKNDGTTRFPLLSYLGLGNNLIQQFDLLWPLSLPQANLLVDIKTNPIESLVNQLSVPFNQPAFRFAMTGNRRLDATNNRLQYLNDGNLLQYGINNVDDFYTFITRLTNYDFRQSNLVRTFLCYCPTSGSQTVSWFMSVKTYLDLTAPIYQLYCSKMPGNVYVLDITTCGYIVPFTLISTTTNQIITNTAQAQSGDTTVASSSKQNENSQYLYLLFLLIIPFIFLILLAFCCCCGRCCQVFTHSSCNLLLCPCSRPKDSVNLDNEKVYDATICYSEYDETWLDEQFLPCLSQFENNYNIHKLSLYNRSSDKISRENERVLRSSKRIILIFFA